MSKAFWLYVFRTKSVDGRLSFLEKTALALTIYFFHSVPRERNQKQQRNTNCELHMLLNMNDVNSLKIDDTCQSTLEESSFEFSQALEQMTSKSKTYNTIILCLAGVLLVLSGSLGTLYTIATHAFYSPGTKDKIWFLRSLTAIDAFAILTGLIGISHVLLSKTSMIKMKRASKVVFACCLFVLVTAQISLSVLCDFRLKGGPFKKTLLESSLSALILILVSVAMTSITCFLLSVFLPQGEPKVNPEANDNIYYSV